MKGYLFGRYKKAVIVFMLVLVLFLVTVDILIVSNQRSLLKDQETNHLNVAIDLTALLLREPLLSHDYDEVEQFLMQWGEENHDVLEIKARMPNGFLLAHYRSPDPQVNIHSIQQQVDYLGRNLITLELIMDHTHSENIMGKLQLQLIAVSLLLALSFAVVLWIVITKLAIKPLEKEIDRRRIAEEGLIESKDNLELKVKERTEELSLKFAEVEKMNKAFVGRELKMKELKIEILELKKNK